MTLPYASGDLYQGVQPGGSVTFTQLFETFYGSGIPQPVTGVSVTVTPVPSGSSVYGPSGADITTTDDATYMFQWFPAAGTEPGDYLVTFTATSQSGALTYTQAVTVTAPESLLPQPGAYATIAQYRTETGDQWTPDSLVGPVLRRATDVIDWAITGAVYPVDGNGMPSRAPDALLFARATCAQCQFMLADNDPTGVKAQYASTNAGGVSVSRTAAAQAQVYPRLAPAAAVILQNAGPLPGAPYVGW